MRVSRRPGRKLPALWARFYTDYDGSSLPSDDLFPNVLETRYQKPRERTDVVIANIKKNAYFAGAIRESDDGKLQLRFSDTAFPLSTADTADRPWVRQVGSCQRRLLAKR